MGDDRIDFKPSPVAVGNGEAFNPPTPSPVEAPLTMTREEWEIAVRFHAGQDNPTGRAVREAVALRRRLAEVERAPRLQCPLDGPGSHRADLREQRVQRERAERAESQRDAALALVEEALGNCACDLDPHCEHCKEIRARAAALRGGQEGEATASMSYGLSTAARAWPCPKCGKITTTGAVCSAPCPDPAYRAASQQERSGE